MFEVFALYVQLLMSFLLQMSEIDSLIQEMKSILYGNVESVPTEETCAQLTQEFFKHDTLRLLINCLPKLNLEVRTHIYIVEFFNPILYCLL